MDGQLFLDYLSLILKQRKMTPIAGEQISFGDRTAFELGEIGACEFARRTKLLRKSIDITTVASQRTYDCPPDFIEIARKRRDRRTPCIAYLETGLTEPVLIDRVLYDDFWDNDTSQTEDIPTGFDIIKKSIAPATITGTTTSNGGETDGECDLVNAAATFTDGDDLVYPRYRVYNTNPAKKYTGVVLEQTGDTTLNTAMFKGDTAKGKGWDSGDTYKIQNTCDWQLIFDYAPSTVAETITMEYYCFPPPVFHPFGMWGFPDPMNVYGVAIYAAWMMRFRETSQSQHVNMEAMKADKLFLMFEHFVESAIAIRSSREKILVPTAMMGIL